MTEGNRYLTLEQELDVLYAAPLSEPFVNSLKLQLNSKIRMQPGKENFIPRLRPAWILLMCAFAFIILTTLIIGPAKVYAEVRRLLGYIPGVGLVDSGAPIRVLAEPVEQTRDGVTITVTSATLTADRTQIDYRIFGVPRSAYPESEDEPGCISLNYLLLPDGTRMDVTSNMPAIPMDVSEVTLVIPCIANTLSGSVPEDWQFTLKFIPAPPDFTVIPVIENTPIQMNTHEPDAADQTTNTPADNSIKVNQVIETEKGYILLGEFTPPEREDGFVQTTGMPVFTDADGTNVPIMYPEDINSLLEGADSWVYEFNAIGVKFPLTITFKGFLITQPEPDAKVEVPFDFGETVVQGQKWQPDMQIELAGHRVRLAEITADSRGGYDFHFKMDPEVYGVRVQIEGYIPNGGGGGGGGGLTNGDFHTSIAYAQQPTGKVTLLFSNLSVISDPLEWQTTWSPTVERTDLPETYELQSGTCGDVNTLQTLPTLPADITGKALVYEQLPDSEDWGLALYNLDGTGRTLVKKSGTWGALSADGSKITYPVEGGFEVYDVASGVVTPYSNAGGYNPVWSNDGTRYAYVRGAAEGVSVMDVTIGVSVPVSSLGWETVVGWLPDDSRLIIAAMYDGGVARQIRSVDPQTGAYDELFEIEDASAKSINAALSPDGQWIAYRAIDNSGVRIMKIDGSQGRLLLDTSYITLSGIVWSDSGWLGVSLLQGSDQSDRLILVNPDSCVVYSVPGIGGTLEGLVIQ